MNFTTELPKRNPLVSYIVASAIQAEKFFPGGSKLGPVFRMHAVILKDPLMALGIEQGKQTTTLPKSYICCHIRQMQGAGEEEDPDGANPVSTRQI